MFVNFVIIVIAGLTRNPLKNLLGLRDLTGLTSNVAQHLASFQGNSTL